MIIRSDEEKNEVKEMVGADVERIMALTLPSISRLFHCFSSFFTSLCLLHRLLSLLLYCSSRWIHSLTVSLTHSLTLPSTVHTATLSAYVTNLYLQIHTCAHKVDDVFGNALHYFLLIKSFQFGSILFCFPLIRLHL